MLLFRIRIYYICVLFYLLSDYIKLHGIVNYKNCIQYILKNDVIHIFMLVARIKYILKLNQLTILTRLVYSQPQITFYKYNFSF